jgi:hypothetical protein
MEDLTIEFYIGDTYTRDFTISGYTESIDNIYMTIKKNDRDKKFLIQKKLNDGIELTDVEYEEDGTTIKSRTYNLLINANETETLKADIEYPFDIEIITEKDDNDVKSTIVKGNVVLKSATTRVWDE